MPQRIDLENYADGHFRYLNPYAQPGPGLRQDVRYTQVRTRLYAFRHNFFTPWTVRATRGDISEQMTAEGLNTSERRSVHLFLTAHPWTVVYEPFAGEYPRQRVWNLSSLARCTNIEDAFRFGYDVFRWGVNRNSEWYCRDDDGWHFHCEDGVFTDMVRAGMTTGDARAAIAALKQKPYYAKVCDTSRGVRNVERFLTPEEIEQMNNTAA